MGKLKTARAEAFLPNRGRARCCHQKHGQVWHRLSMVEGPHKTHALAIWFVLYSGRALPINTIRPLEEREVSERTLIPR